MIIPFSSFLATFFSERDEPGVHYQQCIFLVWLSYTHQVVSELMMHIPFEKKKYDQWECRVVTSFFLSVALELPSRTLFQGNSGHPFFSCPLQCVYSVHLLYSYTPLSQTVCLLGFSPPPGWWRTRRFFLSFDIQSSQLCDLQFLCVCVCVCVCVHSVVSDSSQTPCTVAFRPLCPWNSPCKNTGAGSHFLLQDLPNPGIETFSHISCIVRRILYHWHHRGSPYSSHSFNKYRQLFVNHHIFSHNCSFMPQIPLCCFLVITNFSILHPPGNDWFISCPYSFTFSRILCKCEHSLCGLWHPASFTDQNTFKIHA